MKQNNYNSNILLTAGKSLRTLGEVVRLNCIEPFKTTLKQIAEEYDRKQIETHEKENRCATANSLDMSALRNDYWCKSITIKGGFDFEKGRI